MNSHEASTGPVCCGAPMYLCEAQHTDGKRYFHCHSCTTNREATADKIEDAS